MPYGKVMNLIKTLTGKEKKKLAKSLAKDQGLSLNPQHPTGRAIKKLRKKQREALKMTFE